MDQPTKQPQGNCVANLNYRRNANSKAPAMTGRVSTPEQPDVEFPFSLFQHRDEKGKPYWIGPVDMNRSMRQALNATALKGTHYISTRENGFKVFKELEDGTPNPAYAALTPEEQKHEDDKPAFWGTWTQGEHDKQLRIAMWERDPSRYGPWASGNTQYPLTKEEAAALRAGQPDAAMLNAPEPVPPARGARAKAAAGSRDR